MSEYKFTVKGMHCNSCKMLIEEALEDAGANEIKIELDEANKKGIVSLNSDKTKEELVQLIEAEGDYEVKE